MSREVATLGPETRVDDAWRFLAARGFGQAPVLDAARGLVGLVTLADLLSVLNVDEGGVRDIRASRVSDVMTTPVITTDPVSDVRRVARVLLDYDLPGIPVVGESDELVGLVTRGDILRSVIHEPPLSLWA
jgi:CBS domain-containing protein